VNTIPFSTEVPTEPGAYYYKATQLGEIHVGELLFSASRQRLCFNKGDGFHWSIESLIGGLWSPRLIPSTLLDSLRKENEELRQQAQAQASGRLPQNWFDHEEAYQLHPEYTKAVGITKQAEGFINFWTEQFRRTKEGENWENVTLDPQTGQFKTQMMKPGPEAEVYIQRQLAIETNAHQEYLRKAEQIKQSFVQERGNIVQALQSAEQKFFPQFADPKTYEGPANAVRGMLTKFNQTGNVLGNFLAKSYAFILEQDKVIRELQKNQNAKQVAKEEKTKAGPSYDELQGGKAKAFLSAMKEMKTMIDKDLGMNYIPIWNDETVWNKYLFDNEPEVVLNPSYTYPDSLIKEYFEPMWGKAYQPKLMTLTKWFSLSPEGGKHVQEMMNQIKPR